MNDTININDIGWRDEYIELQRALINALKANKHGWTMEELKAMERLECYEDSLPWNKE